MVTSRGFHTPAALPSWRPLLLLRCLWAQRWRGLRHLGSSPLLQHTQGGSRVGTQSGGVRRSACSAAVGGVRCCVCSTARMAKDGVHSSTLTTPAEAPVYATPTPHPLQAQTLPTHTHTTPDAGLHAPAHQLQAQPSTTPPTPLLQAPPQHPHTCRRLTCQGTQDFAQHSRGQVQRLLALLAILAAHHIQHKLLHGAGLHARVDFDAQEAEDVLQAVTHKSGCAVS